MKFVKCTERLPKEKKYVFGKDDKGIKYACFYTYGGKEEIEFEDMDMLPSWVSSNGEESTVTLNAGWYEQCENQGYYDEMIYPRNIVEWLDESDESLTSKEEGFQKRVDNFVLECFGAEIASDKVERNHRFLEEALELVQSIGCTKEDALMLVDYVFDRPTGETSQEIGGVMVTLAALCNANAKDMNYYGEVELVRVWNKIEKIREKQKSKPKNSPLPQPPTS